MAKKNVWNNEHCPTYDPKTEGYGSKDSWKKALHDRMSLEEADNILGDDDPLTILGLQRPFTVSAMYSAWRKYAMKWHPDRHPKDEASQKKATEEFKKGHAAFVKLGGR